MDPQNQPTHSRRLRRSRKRTALTASNDDPNQPMQAPKPLGHRRLIFSLEETEALEQGDSSTAGASRTIPVAVQASTPAIHYTLLDDFDVSLS